MTNFEKLYNEVIKKSLVEKFGYKNPPRDSEAD